MEIKPDLTPIFVEQHEPEQRWEVSLSPIWTGKLIEALAKAQLKYKPVLKTQENEAFSRGLRKSKYADLVEYIDATQAALAEHGLVVTQWPDVSPQAKSMSLISYLMHSSGEWMRGKLTLPALNRDGFTAQSCGTAITYARRYSYAAITGCASEDDDGNAASGQGSKAAAQEVAKGKIAEAHQSLDPKVREIASRAEAPTTLFYVMPEAHNGHFAEFINIKEFGSGLDQVAAESLKRMLVPYTAKVTKNNTILVATDKLDSLLEKLAGDCGITVKKLEAA